MRIDNISKEALRACNETLYKRADKNKTADIIKYIDLGTCTVRIICLAKEFLPLIEKQLTYTIKDSLPDYNATIVVWKEDDMISLSQECENSFDREAKIKIRVRKLATKEKYFDYEIFDEEYSKHNPITTIDNNRGFATSYDKETNTYYYGVRNLNPEEFIKEGHIFVQFFNKILKTPTTNLVHGAVVGLNNFGVLFCARGQRGKSTLAVLSMLRGFEYVSDDYLTLEKDGNNLYAHPIYSIITLSERMYNELYYELDGKFVSNNARKDKYVINIEKYHNTFKKRYPIKICMFPEIINDKEPSIVAYSKGRAITQLVHSTINQMQDKHDIKTIQKLIGFVKDFDYYKINLCSDIYKNVECLREFINKLSEEMNNDKLCIK